MSWRTNLGVVVLGVAWWLGQPVATLAVLPACAPLPRVSPAPPTASQAIVTPLTPSSNAVVQPLRDLNNDTMVFLQLQGGRNVWTVLLSAANVGLQLPNDRGNGIVIFHKGLTLRYQQNERFAYYIVLDGEITDDGTQYHITGKILGRIPCCEP